ncbi:class I SAM-dependent methyltransferase [Paenibacillus sp. strain BS8-2]
MSNHYYSKTPEVKHNRQIVETLLRGRQLKFMTDAGVFSKASVDFGSKVLIEAMELRVDDRVLDVGCGYGPIGLSAASLASQGMVTMIDINGRAIELAKENAALNGISNVKIMQSDLYESVTDEEYDVILTNPPIRAGKAVVHQIFEEGHTLLKKGGSMWVVIQKKQGAPSALEKLEQVYEEVVEVTKDKGYRIFRAKK